MSRRVGLTANAPGLLKTVGNRPRQAQRAPVADDAPPLSTDDENDTFSEGTVQAAKASDRTASPKRKASRRPVPPIDSDIDTDTSTDERSRRAAIKPTAFASKKKQEQKASTKRRKVSESPEPESRKSSQDKLKPGSHLKNKWGLTAKKEARATYGKQARGSQSSQPGSSQGSVKKLRVPSSIESPQKKKSSRFILPGKNILSSPTSSPRKLLTDLNGNADSEDEDSILAPLKSKKGTKKGKKKLSPPPPPSPPRAVFKLPQNFLDKSPGGETPTCSAEDLAKLSSDEGSQDDDLPSFKIPEELHEPPATKCPWCGEEVDKALLDDFGQGKRLNVRMQTRFCNLHKQRTAEQTWKDLDYPTIDWDAIETRFAAHRGRLLAIVEGRASHFRNIHAKNVQEGRARSMKRDENFNPGYYGPRGFNAMCDYLVQEFSAVLKKRAVDDRVIAGRGSAAFIQAVLVAELGVRLIMDDMDLSESEARQVMEDSKVLGELVQPELDR